MKDYYNSMYVKTFPGRETVDAKIKEVTYNPNHELLIKVEYSASLPKGKTLKKEVEVLFDSEEITDVLKGFKVTKPEEIKSGKKVKVILQHQHGVGLRI